MNTPRQFRQKVLPGWDHTDTYETTLAGVARALRESSPFADARVEQAGNDPREPEFYVVTMRVPGDERTRIQPVSLFFLLSPDWFAHEPAGELTYVAALGQPAAAISARRFLRTWHEGRVGGEVIYRGALENGVVRTPAVAALSRFGEQRDEVASREYGSGSIGVWPLSVDAPPRLCAICLLPAAQWVCPKCGKPVLERREGR